MTNFILAQLVNQYTNNKTVWYLLVSDYILYATQITVDTISTELTNQEIMFFKYTDIH